MHQWSRVVLLLLPLLTGGCVTNALWNKTDLDAWNEPASNAELRLFEAGERKDFLVVYNEYSERRNSIRTRAYFLNQNQRRVTDGWKPRFVSTRASRGLPQVPVFQTVPDFHPGFSPTIYALVSTDHQSFAICSGTGRTDYDLAVYNDGRGRIYRTALTPIAVAADLTIIGGYLGCWYVYCVAESGYTVSVH